MPRFYGHGGTAVILGGMETKICRRCEMCKSIDEFRILKKTGNRAGVCTPCYKEQRAAYKVSFYSNPKNLEHKKEHERSKYRSDQKWRENRLAYVRKWKDQRPNYRKENKLKDYGLTLDQYNDMFEAQGGVCAICKRPETNRLHGKIKALAVDHDHRTRKTRALLCSNHNRALGLFGDDPELLRAALEYLISHLI